MNVPLSNYPYTRTYRFGEEHVTKLIDMAQTLRKDQAEIVREAVEEYFERHMPQTSQAATPATPTAA